MRVNKSFSYNLVDGQLRLKVHSWAGFLESEFSKSLKEFCEEHECHGIVIELLVPLGKDTLKIDLNQCPIDCCNSLEIIGGDFYLQTNRNFRPESPLKKLILTRCHRCLFYTPPINLNELHVISPRKKLVVCGEHDHPYIKKVVVKSLAGQSLSSKIVLKSLELTHLDVDALSRVVLKYTTIGH